MDDKAEAPSAPSLWIARFAGQVPSGPVLDVAAGSGRHSVLFLDLGHPVLAIDRDVARLRPLADRAGFEARANDLEVGGDPLPGGTFAAVVVTNYLHRSLLPSLIAAVAPQGWLLYETFAVGNEQYGRPSNPDFLLRPDELIDAVRGRLEIVAYEHMTDTEPRLAVRQRIAARRT
ncbi:MAG: SAM-dependent methyltransferase [Dongiaceae bacterium]